MNVLLERNWFVDVFLISYLFWQTLDIRMRLLGRLLWFSKIGILFSPWKYGRYIEVFFIGLIKWRRSILKRLKNTYLNFFWFQYIYGNCLTMWWVNWNNTFLISSFFIIKNITLNFFYIFLNFNFNFLIKKYIIYFKNQPKNYRSRHKKDKMRYLRTA